MFDLTSSRVGLVFATSPQSVLRDATPTLVVFPKLWRVTVLGLLPVATVCGCVAVGMVYRSAAERSFRSVL